MGSVFFKQQAKPKQATKTPEVHAVKVDAYEDVLATFEVHNVRSQSNNIIWVDLDVDGKPLKMELDTGWAVSIIFFDLYQQKFNRLPVHNTGLSFKTCTGENIMSVEVLKVLSIKVSKYKYDYQSIWIAKPKERCWTCMLSRIRVPLFWEEIGYARYA